jgi:hypothetical protein
VSVRSRPPREKLPDNSDYLATPPAMIENGLRGCRVLSVPRARFAAQLSGNLEGGLPDAAHDRQQRDRLGRGRAGGEVDAAVRDVLDRHPLAAPIADFLTDLHNAGRSAQTPPTAVT